MRLGRPLALCALLLVLPACASGSARAGRDASAGPPTQEVPAPGDSGVLLTFDGADVLAPATAVAGVRVRSLGDAPLRTVVGGDGTRGLEFPSYAPGKGEQRLVLVLDGARPVAPAPSSGLTFGADVKLETGTTSGTVDNGDNVVQRGLFADEDQLKLQVDHRVPSCTVRTPRGRSVVELPQALDGGWWRLRCHYDGVELSATGTALAGQSLPTRASAAAVLGALSFAPGTAVSVGGKVTAAGALVKTQPDQLNGALDNVLVSPAP